MENPFKYESAPNFGKPEVQQAFVQEAHDAVSLLQKEMDINLAEQALLGERMRLMTGFVNDLPATDPQYSMMIIQVQMDQIELDELKRRAVSISEKLNNR